MSKLFFKCYLDKYYSFFAEYGTHYISHGTVGGTIVMETSIKKSLLKKKTETEISYALSVGYDGLVNQGNMSVSTAYASSTFLEENRKDIDIQISTLGGLYAPDKSISEWQLSLYEIPVILFNTQASTGRITRLVPISELMNILAPEKHKSFEKVFKEAL